MIPRETATEEINSWLDHKKVSDKKRESNKEHIDILVDAISDGTMILNEDKTLTHKLKFPIESGDEPISSLTYKPRLQVQTVNNHLTGVKPSDADGRIVAYMAALASKPKEVIKRLDTEDYSIAQSVVMFFL